MKRSLQLFALVAVASALIAAPAAHAEDNAVPTQFNEVFSIIEKLILGENINLNPVELGACAPTPSLGLFSVNFFFAQSMLCPISGNISLGLLPTRATVSLDMADNLMLERISMDVRFKVKLTGGLGGTTQTDMAFEDGYLLVRPLPGAPVEHWIVTGKGTRLEGKGKIDGKTRVNFFNGATREGYAMLKTVTRDAKKSPKQKSVQVCTLTEADPLDYLVGTLDACQSLVEKE